MSAQARTVAVIGGNGFIGAEITRTLLRAGHHVRVIARNPSSVAPHPSLSTVAHDVAHAPPDLTGCDAVVNAVGLKAERGANTFAAAHVRVVENLIRAMKRAGVARLVHISVAKLPPTLSAYAATKCAGEEAATASGLDVTILRPALVIGPGDDATTNLIRFVRVAPVFPISTGPLGPLAPVDVRDVAEAVPRCLSNEATVGAIIDLAGPDAVDIRELVQRVARALSLPTLLVPVPAAAQRLAAAVFERLPGAPVVTRSQLAMLSHGLAGDRSRAQALLGLSPRGLPPQRIAELAESVSDIIPSLRIAPTPAHQRFIADRAAATPSLAWFVPLAMAAMLALPWLLPNVWVRMAAVETLLAGLAIAAIPTLKWGSVFGAQPRRLAAGLAAAAALYVGCYAGFALTAALAPDLAAGASVMLAWPSTMAMAIQLPLLVLIIVGEDIVWRGAIGIPLVSRLGPVPGVLASAALFAVAHMTTGPPILWVAALVCGAFWTALVIRTRSLAAAVVCHITWDVLVLYVLPLG